MSTKTPAFGFIDICERDMDFLFAEEIECDPAFREWLINRTGGVSEAASVIRLGRSVSTNHGETDLLVVHSTPHGSDRALMIENKISAPFTRLQAERYRRRGADGIRNGEWGEYATILVAPRKRLIGVAANAFDYQICYEDCLTAVSGSGPRADFKRRALEEACGKGRKAQATRMVDQAISAWFSEARRLSLTEFPDLPLPAETGRAAGAVELYFILKQFPQSRVYIEIKPDSGVVDMRFYGVPVGDVRREFSGSIPVNADTDQARSGKSSSIRFRHTPLDLKIPFPGQEAMLRPMLQSADTLWRLAQKHSDGIMTLLGYEETGAI